MAMTTSDDRDDGPRLGHLVLCVRDIEASHHFYTEVVGFRLVGKLNRPSDGDIDMRFYLGSSDTHHELALMQSSDPEAAPEKVPFDVYSPRVGVNHLAIEYPTREAFLRRVEHLAAQEVPVILRGNHGMTHSAYIEDPDGHGVEIHYSVPSEYWRDDLDSALSHFEFVTRRGPVQDSTDYVRFGHPQS